MRRLVVLAFVGLFAQLVDGALGMAYGVSSTTLLLATGLAPAVASASVHLAEVGTTMASGVAHARFGNVDWSTVRRIAGPGALGAFLGAVVLSSLSTESAKPWTSSLLLVLGLYLLVRFTVGGRRRRPGSGRVRTAFLAPLGLVAGFIDATGGGGWGPVATPALLTTGALEPRRVIGSVDTSEVLVAGAASIGFLVSLGRQGVQMPIVLALLAGGLVAAPVAAWLVRVVPAHLLGAGVGGFIVLTNSRTLLAAAGAAGGTRTVVYLAIVAGWALALALAVRARGAAAREELSGVVAG
jgi:hypothetical protein